MPASFQLEFYSDMAGPVKKTQSTILEASLEVLKLRHHPVDSQCPQQNHWIPAFAGMTTFAASCGELNLLR
jgi:hypothetical protein